MYDHVIVSVDGGLESRAAMAPAADLAWRCGAKLVVVSTTPIKGSANDLLKGNAMARSGADVDFWVDRGRSPGEAILETVAHRSAPVVVLCSRPRRGGLLRRGGTTPLPVEVLLRCPVPMVVIGPRTDVAGGLPLGELIVPVEGSEASRRAALLAARLAQTLRLGVQLLSLVPPTVHDPTPGAAVRAVQGQVEAIAPHVSCEVVQTAQPAAAVVAIADETESSAVVCPWTGDDQRHPLGTFAGEIVRTCSRAVVLAPRAA